MDLILEYEEHHLSSERHKETERTRQGDLLRSFNKADTLRVPNGLVSDLSRVLGVGE